MDADFIIRTFVSTSKTASLTTSSTSSTILPAIFTLTSVVLGILQGHFANNATANVKWAPLQVLPIPAATRTIPGPPSATGIPSPYILTSLIVIFVGILVGAASTGYQRTKSGMTFTSSKPSSSNGNGSGRGRAPRQDPPPPSPPSRQPPRDNQPNRRPGGSNPGNDPNPQGNETSIGDKGKGKSTDKQPGGSNPGGDPDDPNGGSNTEPLPERPRPHSPEDGPGQGILLCIGLFIVWYFFSPQLRTAKAWLDACVEQELRRINDGFGEFAALVEHELRRVNVGATFDGTSETLRRGSNVGDSRPHSIEELEEFKFRPAPLTTLAGLLSLSSPVVCHVDVCPRHALPAAPLPNSLIVFNINIPHSLKVALGCLILGSLSFAARHRHVQSPLVEVAIVNTPCSKLGPEVPVDLHKIALMTPLPPDAESDFPVQDLFALALTIPLPPDRQQDFPVRDLFAVALTVSLPPDQEQDFSPAPLPPPEEEDFPIDDSLIFPRELSDIPPHGPFALAPTTPLPRLWTDYIVEESFQYPPRGLFPYEPEYLFPLTDLDNTFFKLALQTPLPPELDSDLLDEHLLAVRTPLPEDKESEWDDEISREIAQERCKVLVQQWKRATGRDSVEPLSSFNQPFCVLGAHNGTSAPPKEDKKGKEPEVKLSAIEIRKAQIAEARRRTTNKHPSSSYRHSYGLPSHIVPSTPPKDDDKENAMMAQMSPQERRQAIIKKRARACLYDTELPSSSYKPATLTAAPAVPSTIHIPRPPPPTTPSLDEADKAAIHTRLRELREATRETRAEKNKQRDETPVKRFEWSREAQLANLDIGKERVKLGVGESEFYMPPAPTTGPRAHQYDPDPENPAKVVHSTSEEIRELLVILYANKNRDEIDALTLEYLNFK